MALPRCQILSWLMDSEFLTCFSPSARSSVETDGAPLSRRRRLSLKSPVTGRCVSSTHSTPGTGSTATRATRRPSISRRLPVLGIPRYIGPHFVHGYCLRGSRTRSFAKIAEPKEDEIGRLNRVLVIVYCLEVGLVLIVAPWTRFWDRNYFVEYFPLLEPSLTSPVVRGTFSGFGIVTLGAAVVDLTSWLWQRWTRRHDSSARSVLARSVELGSQDLRENV